MAKKEKIEKFNKGEVIIYKSSKNEIELKVRFKDETVWLDAHKWREFLT